MTVHVYVSTACQHGLHQKCRETCKYCGTTCSCAGCDHSQLEAHPVDVLKDELRTVRHDLEHVTQERDEAERERDLLRRQINAVISHCGPNPRWVRSTHIKDLFRHDPANNPPITDTLPPEFLLGVAAPEEKP